MVADLVEVFEVANDNGGVVVAFWRGEFVVWNCWNVYTFRELCQSRSVFGGWQFEVDGAGLSGGSYFRGDGPERRADARAYALKEAKARVKARGGAILRWALGLRLIEK
jgi:hypothetical protein